MLGVERERRGLKDSYQSQETDYLTLLIMCESRGFSIGALAQLYTSPRSVHSDIFGPLLIVAVTSNFFHIHKQNREDR